MTSLKQFILNHASHAIVAVATPGHLEAAVQAFFFQEPEAVDLSRYQIAVGGKAVIELSGVIMHRAGSSRWHTSCDDLLNAIRAALADTRVTEIILKISSPGGYTYGVAETAEAIRALRGTKPITAMVTDLCASAAYYLASACDTILAERSSMVGSVGVFILHMEMSRMMDAEGVTVTFIRGPERKAEGNPYEVLSEQARNHFQSIVDQSVADFQRDVATGRGITTEKVKADFGSGALFTASTALSVGMIDAIVTLEDVLSATPATPRLNKARRRALVAKGADYENAGGTAC